MPPTDLKMMILRRISALLIFLLVLVAFAVLFYYKYIPANKEELNLRGHRVLNQIIRNFQDKDDELREIVNTGGQKDSSELIDQQGSYSKLNSNIRYEAMQYSRGDTLKSLYRDEDGEWKLKYKADSATAKQKPIFSFKMGDFAGPLLSARNDIFQTYYILLDSRIDQGVTKKHAFFILCSNKTESESAEINLDTLQYLEKNSDKSGICFVTIGGEKYVLFYSSFSFHNSRLLMTGLIPEAAYYKKIQSTPLYLISTTIILISLILSILPLLKLFLLSSNEFICSRDVLKTAFSFYIGSMIVTLIAFYIFAVYVTHLSMQRRLQQFSNDIRKDIETDITQADTQIKYYDTAIGSLKIHDTVKTDLLETGLAASGKTDDLIDTLCTPRTFLNVSRLIWGDTDGSTMAKWSPFSYSTPFTELNNYQFFKILDQKPAYFFGTPGLQHPVVYPGKSNLTDEFLTSIARRSNAQFLTGKASFIVISGMLHTAILPVVPNGFGFALIDNTGNVLIDSDPQRNLSENLFEEAGDQHLLQDIVRTGRSDISFEIELYGNPYIARVTPIAGQPLTLICFYDERTPAANIYRYLHFSIHTLAILLAILIACLLLSTYSEWRPTLLHFKIHQTAWLRPSSTNTDQRVFIFAYFAYLIILTIVFFGLIAVFSSNLDNIFYISMLLPFYAFIGVQLSQMDTAWDLYGSFGSYIRASIYPLACIVILNIAIGLLMTTSGQAGVNFLIPATFQLLILFVKPLIRWRRLGPWIMAKKLDFFRYSVYSSILLISVLPALGLLTYGFYAEKIQFKKDKLLKLSNAFFYRSNYLVNDFLPTIKLTVHKRLVPDYDDNLIYNSSIYLTDQDKITHWTPDTITRREYLSDGLYSLLMDKIYLAPQIWGDEVCIQNVADDSSWSYRASKGSGITYALNRPVTDSSVADNHIQLSSGLQKPQQDFFSLPVAFIFFFCISIFALLALSKKAIKEAIKRLFLLDIVNSSNIPGGNSSSLTKYFTPDKMPSPTSYLANLAFPNPFTIKYFDHERNFDIWAERPQQFSQEEFILAMADYFKTNYKAIWNDLDDHEKYILYDFSSDRYTNYKNSIVLYKLISKGVLTQKGECLDVFSLSFRQYVLSLQNTKAITDLKTNFRVYGTWDSVRIPVLAILALVAVFLFITQSAFSSAVVAAITALSTMVPMIIRLFSRSNGTA